MTIHELKIAAIYFAEVISGKKTFEIRQNDRDFQSGDQVVLKEMGGTIGSENYEPTGRRCKALIGYVCDYGQPQGQVVFSLLDVSLDAA